MKHTEILAEANKILAPRGSVYGGVRENHDRIANIANSITGLSLTAHDVAMVLVAVKLSRILQSPTHTDSYVDAINYLSFAGEFASDGMGEGEGQLASQANRGAGPGNPFRSAQPQANRV